jgi:8-oxo-dGTP pyrophosphatase MutT (NUDIX family)
MSANLAAFLRRIPQSNQDAQKLENLAPDLDSQVLQGYLLLLQTLGAVQLHQDSVKASSQTAKYLLESLATYVENGQKLVDDWHTRGVYREENGVFQNAATLLFEMEKRRIALQEAPRPSRREEVAQVLIKRTNPVSKQAEFLLQYDKNAHQFQLIGGRRKHLEEDLHTTMIREIEEELADELKIAQDYQLVPIILDLSPTPILSPTFGALTEYHFWIFHMRDLSRELSLQANDAWVSVDEVLAGKVHWQGQIVESNPEIYQLINQHIEGGLTALADSFRN